jgi:retinol dehydrogenase-8
MPQEIVLITGTSSGIGLSAAAMLAKHPGQKFKVYAAMRNPAKKDELVKKAEGCADKDLFVIQLDVCSDDSVNAAVKQVLDKEGGSMSWVSYGYVDCMYRIAFRTVAT